MPISHCSPVSNVPLAHCVVAEEASPSASDEATEDREDPSLEATHAQELLHVWPSGQGMPISHCSLVSSVPLAHCALSEEAEEEETSENREDADSDEATEDREDAKEFADDADDCSKETEEGVEEAEEAGTPNDGEQKFTLLQSLGQVL